MASRLPNATGPTTSIAIKGADMTDKAETSPDLDEARRRLYWPLKPEDGGGYFLWKQFDPDLATKMSQFFVGGLYQREVITKRERQLCVVAALTVLRCGDELRAHIHAARNLGASKAEIAEVIFQMLTYGGAPAMVQALKTAKAAFVERGEWDEKAPEPGT
jgi:4-carboxymuconolactone decarboxylase